MGKDLKGKELGKCLYQRKDGRYEAKAQINGIKIDIIDKNLKTLKEKLKSARELAEKQVDYKKSDITLDEWFDEWFIRYKQPKVKVSSIAALKRSYKNGFGIYLGKKKISEITSDNIQDVINYHQQNGKAASTTRSALSLLQQCFERAVNNQYIPINPCYDLCVSWEKESGDKLSRFLSEEEQIRFLKETKGNWYEEMLYIMFLTGMRVGEIGGLKWDDIDFETKCINVERSLSCNYDNGVKVIMMTKPKTPNSKRSIPFMGECEQMLKSQKKKQLILKNQLGSRWRGNGEFDNLVFTSTMGSPVTRYIAEKEIKNIVKSINISEQINSKIEKREAIIFDNVYPHAIRHSFCSRCFERGMNPKVVQKLMGHAHYSTTIDIYTHITKKLFDKEIDKFGTILSNDEDLKEVTKQLI